METTLSKGHRIMKTFVKTSKQGDHGLFLLISKLTIDY